VPERRDGDDRPGNVCCLVAPDGTVHRYAKRHPFGMAGERDHYRAGDEHVTVDVDGVRITPTVCYDLRFPEQYRATVDDTDAYLVVASWPAPRRQHWSTLLVARAIESQAYVVGVNRVGTDGNGTDHAGGSVVVDPLGHELVRAGDAATVLSADLDTELVARTRRDLPFLPDRRADELPPADRRPSTAVFASDGRRWPRRTVAGRWPDRAPIRAGAGRTKRRSRRR
jgi:predicted amidohydrolase